MNCNSQNRLQKVKLNSAVTLTTQFCQIVLGVITRRLFINYLGVTYLGYDSVFTNILQMLNLADMGIGVAITSYLYKPLAEGDRARITAIMSIYKKLYTVLGFVVLGIGLMVSVFLNMLIPDANCGTWYLRILFYINLIGVVSTYFLAYKRTLLIADQKSYLTNAIDTIVYLAIAILQLVSLIFAPSYIIYLLLNIAKNIISNIMVSIKVNRDYKHINNKPETMIVQEYRPRIFQYVKDVFVSRIGAAVYYSTDNIILSVLKGSLLTGYLSNYTLITGQLNAVVIAILGSVQATFGNFINTTDDRVKRLEMTDNYFCVNFCIGNFCMICFSLLAQPFVKLFFGENMLLPFSTAIWLGINLMLTFLIQLPSQVFIIYKLFRHDRPIIIISALLNIIISVALAYRMGINGVLIGTCITSLVYLFSRFYIIAKYVYKIGYGYYVKKILCYGVVSVIDFFVVYLATADMTGDGVAGFCIKLLVVSLLSILVTSILLSFSKEFEFLKRKLIPDRVRWLASKTMIFIGCVAIVITSIIIGRNERVDYTTKGNKSYIRSDTYTPENNTGRNIFSLSFDDTIEIFKDINDNQYDSIFQNATLNWYRKLHSKYGVVISCYCYYESGDFNLSQFTDRYKTEFEENSDWLRFGFNAINADTNYQSKSIVEDYTKTIKELERIVGADSIDNVVRLQMFQGSYSGVKELSELSNQPVIGLLTADDRRQSYYLDAEKNDYIYNHDELYDPDTGMYLFSTDFRIEYVGNVDSKLVELSKECWNNQTGDLVVFSHEWALNIENQEKIEKVCEYAKKEQYAFIFLEDAIRQNVTTCQ